MAIVLHAQSNVTTLSCEAFIGTGSIPVSASGHTWTSKHIGLRYIWNASGVTVYASVGNGSAESTVALGGSVNSTRKIRIKYVSSSLVEFYNANVLVASLTTNIPIGSIGDTFVQASTATISGTGQCLLYLDRFAYADPDL